MYNERLANSILAKLDELFPKPTSSDDLKEFQVPGFAQLPKRDWLEAIDALLKLGLVSGDPDREGSTLRYVVNLLITARGREGTAESYGQANVVGSISLGIETDLP